MSVIGSGGFVPALVKNDLGVTGEASVLASEHGMSKRAGITIDSSKVTADGNGDKVVKAGTVLVVDDATGKYEPYVPGSIDPTDEGYTPPVEALGVLTTSVNARWGDVVTHLLLHGSLLRARMVNLDPVAEGLMAGRIIFQ